MKRSRPLRRTPIRRQSQKARERHQERRRAFLDPVAGGSYVEPCEGAGILPPCPTREHRADAPHEPGRRSQGADPTRPEEAINLCNPGHMWVHDHPLLAHQLRTRDGRSFYLLSRG